MSNFIDLTNQRFGNLIVLERNGYDNNKKILWKCQCDCGTIKNIRGNDLKSGKILSCGCFGKEQRKIANQNKKNLEQVSFREDLTGKIFGRLTVIEFDEQTTLLKKQKNGKSLGSWWKCQCACGNIISVQGSSLKGGRTKSCGCLQSEISRENMKKIQYKGAQTRLVDLTGQKFGKLTVIKRFVQNNNQNKPLWECICDCGNMHIVDGNSLKSGSTQSCGCIGNSRGEQIIKEILLKNNISFAQQVSFSDLKDKNVLRFDFAILDDQQKIKKLIEFDGRQHFDKTSAWYSENQINHDLMKTNYCKEKNIPLLRISYKDIDKISLEWLIE